MVTPFFIRPSVIVLSTMAFGLVVHLIGLSFFGLHANAGFYVSGTCIVIFAVFLYGSSSQNSVTWEEGKIHYRERIGDGLMAYSIPKTSSARSWFLWWILPTLLLHGLVACVAFIVP